MPLRLDIDRGWLTASPTFNRRQCDEAPTWKIKHTARTMNAVNDTIVETRIIQVPRSKNKIW